jgi:hypothetical protein
MSNRSLITALFVSALLAPISMGAAALPTDVISIVKECDIRSHIEFPPAIIRRNVHSTISCSHLDSGISCSEKITKLEHDVMESPRATYRAACLKRELNA